MVNYAEEVMVDALRKLSCKIEDIIQNGISKGILISDEETYFRWKCTNFQYSEEGVGPQLTGEYFNKKDWRIARQKVISLVKESTEWSSILEMVNEFTHKESDREIEVFSTKLISTILESSNFDRNKIDYLVSLFLKDIKGEPVKVKATVELNGILIMAPEIRFKFGNADILLRQIIAEDYEKEYRVDGLSNNSHRLVRPCAILEIEIQDRDAIAIQLKVEQSVAILRLFRVGSIRYISYEMSSESFTSFIGGTISTLEHSIALNQYIVKETDIESLNNFWRVALQEVPKNFYWTEGEQLNHKGIAYKRYCDALLLNGMVERRIANAVMGLEALFLKGTENQELIYRLSIRIAKLFALLEHEPYKNPHKIRDVIGDVYNIRSSFVHGNQLSYKGKIKLTRTYGDINSLLYLLLDYLRISIVVWVFVKKDKDEFLDLIDGALLDKGKEDLLSRLLANMKNVLQ